MLYHLIHRMPLVVPVTRIFIFIPVGVDITNIHRTQYRLPFRIREIIADTGIVTRVLFMLLCSRQNKRMSNCEFCQYICIINPHPVMSLDLMLILFAMLQSRHTTPRVFTSFALYHNLLLDVTKPIYERKLACFSLRNNCVWLDAHASN